MTEQLQRITATETWTENLLTSMFVLYTPCYVSVRLRPHDKGLTNYCNGLHTELTDHDEMAPHQRRCRKWQSALAMSPGLRACPSPPSRGHWAGHTTWRRTPWPRSWTRLAGWATAQTSRHAASSRATRAS